MNTMRVGKCSAVVCSILGLVGGTMAAGQQETTGGTPPATSDAASPSAPETAMKKPDAFLARGSHLISISYGYISTDYEDVDQDADGWRISGVYELIPTSGPLIHGLSIGYMESSAEWAGTAQTLKAEAKTIPVYYAPKIILGKKALRLFAKGALGFQYTKFSVDGNKPGVDSADFGLYAGVSLGGMVVVKEKFFANLEYEWAYMGNSYYRDAGVSSVMLGVGVKL